MFLNKTTLKLASEFICLQGSKLTLANSQNASHFWDLRMKKIFTSIDLRVRIIFNISQELFQLKTSCKKFGRNVGD